MSVNEGSLELGEGLQVAVLSSASPNGVVPRPLYGQAQSDGSVALEVAIVSGGSGGGGGGLGTTTTPNVGQLADGTTPTRLATVSAAGALKVDNSAVVQPVSGTFWQATQPVSIASSVAVTGTFWQATQPVSLTSLPALPSGTNVIGSTGTTTTPSISQIVDGTTPTQKAAISASGAQFVCEGGSTATRTIIAASTTAGNLIAANTLARKRIIVNDSTGGICYVGFGSTAPTTSDWTYKLQYGGTLETDFIGQIQAIWDVASGNARVTEITA